MLVLSVSASWLIVTFPNFSNILIGSLISLGVLVYIAKTNRWVFLIVLLLPVRDWALFSLGPANIRLGDMAVLVALLFWLTRLPLDKSLPLSLPRSPLTWVILIFIGYMLISVAWADSFSMGLTRAIKLVRAGTIYVLFIIAFVKDWDGSLHQLMVGVALGTSALSLAWGWSAAQGGGLTTLAGLDEFTSVDIPAEFRSTGAGFLSTFGSQLLALYVFLLIGYLPFLSKRRHILIIGALAFAGIIVVIGSLFRSLMISMTVGLTVIFFWGKLSCIRKIQNWLNVLFGIGLLVFLIGFATGFDRILEGRFMNATTDVSFVKRLEFSETAINWWSASPGTALRGIGPGTFMYRTTKSVHSLYVQILSEQGLIGVSIFLVLILVTISEIWQAYVISRRQSDFRYAWLAIILGGAYASYLTMSLAGSDFSEFNYWLIAILSVSLKTRVSDTTLVSSISTKLL